MFEFYKNNKNKRFNDLIKFVNTSNNLEKKEIINYLNDLQKNNTESFCSDEILKEIIYLTINKIDDKNGSRNFSYYFQIAEYIYSKNVLIETDDSFDNFLGLYKIILDLFEDSVIVYKSNSKTSDYKQIDLINSIYNVFEDKNIIYSIIKKIIDDENLIIILVMLDVYIKNTRLYFTNEKVFSNTIFDIIETYRHNGYQAAPEINQCFRDLIIEKTILAKKNAGIYEVDEEKLIELENRANQLQKKLDDLEKKSNHEQKREQLMEQDIRDILKNTIDFQNQIIDKTNNNDNSFNVNHRKKYKIINTNFDIEKRMLLKKICLYNQTFKLTSSNILWFNKNVIESLGYKFVASLDSYQQRCVSIFYEKNLINKYIKLIKINSSFYVYFDEFINETIFNTFKLTFIASSLTSKEFQRLTIKLWKLKKLDVLLSLFKINNNFNIYYEKFIECIDDAFFDKFDLKYIAFSNFEIQKMIYIFFAEDQLDKLIETLKIKNDFIMTKYGASAARIRQIYNANELIEFFDNDNHLLDLFNICYVEEEIFIIEKYKNMTKKNKIKLNNFIKEALKKSEQYKEQSEYEKSVQYEALAKQKILKKLNRM